MNQAFKVDIISLSQGGTEAFQIPFKLFKTFPGFLKTFPTSWNFLYEHLDNPINKILILYLHLLSIWYWMAVDLHESGIQSRHHLLLWCWMHLNFGPSVAQASVHLWEVIKRNTMLYIINRIPHKIWSLHLLLCRS